MEDSYFETFSFHGTNGAHSPMCELTVTNCSPGAGPGVHGLGSLAAGVGVGVGTPGISTTDPMTGLPAITSFSSSCMHHDPDAAAHFAAELERRHSEAVAAGFTSGSSGGGGAGESNRANAVFGGSLMDAVRTPDGMLMPLRANALKRLSLASSVSSSAPSTATSEVDGSEDLDREAFAQHTALQHLPQQQQQHNMSISDSASTLASLPELVASHHHHIGASTVAIQPVTVQPQPQQSQSQSQGHGSFKMSDFIADSDAAEFFETELDKTVDSAQALTLSTATAASYTTPQRPPLFRRSASGTASSSIFSGTQSLTSASSSSPESSPGSPSTPASVFGGSNALAAAAAAAKNGKALQEGLDDELPKEDQEATLRARRLNHANNVNNRQSILSNGESIFGSDQSPRFGSPGHLASGPSHSPVPGGGEEARAGLGLFGVGGAGAGAGSTGTSSRALSRSSSLSVYDTLSCNPADIAPAASSSSTSAASSVGASASASAHQGSVSPALVEAQQASSSSSAQPMYAPSPHAPPHGAAAVMYRDGGWVVPSPTFGPPPPPHMLHPLMPMAIARSPISLYASEGVYHPAPAAYAAEHAAAVAAAAEAHRGRTGHPLVHAVPHPHAHPHGGYPPGHMLSTSLPNGAHFVPPPHSPLIMHPPPQRPASSLGPMRRPSTISTHSASPYSRTVELSISTSPLPHQRHFADANGSSAGLVLTPTSLAPSSPALSARSGVSGTSATSSTPSHLSQYTDPVTGIITKRSRGRRVPNNPEEINNLGKSGKVYTCKIPGCGKCFKRSEHLKRHVRSIHTDEKPYTCPFPGCGKKFSRHDNLNQHARVHNLENVPISATLPPGHPLAQLGAGTMAGAGTAGVGGGEDDSPLADDDDDVDAISL